MPITSPVEWFSASCARDKWELSDLKVHWENEAVRGEKQLIDGWHNIIKNIVKFVSYIQNELMIFFSSVLSNA